MIDLQSVRTIAAKELHEALLNRWFLLFTLAFTALTLALSSLANPGGSRLALSGYSRTTASLINLVLLFVPLIGLTLGSANLASNYEAGTLAYLLAQPISRAEVILGKYLGIAIALFTTILFGFGLAGVALATQHQVSDVGGYIVTVILACALALAMLSLGFLISTIAHKTAAALGGALFLWLLLVFIGDLGLIGTALITHMPVELLFFVSILNPLQLFKIASVLSIQADLHVLGPAGLYATGQFGAALLPMLIGGLLLWIGLPLLGALALFARQERQTSKGNPL